MENNKKDYSINKTSYKPNRSCRSCNGKGWIVSIPVEYLCRECNGTGVK